MKTALALALLCAVAGVALAQSEWTPPAYDTFWFQQDLDHFDFKTGPDVTWKQRYLMEVDALDKWTPGDPILFYTGNEENIVTFWNNTGNVFFMAPELDNALIVFAEHRYYGESLPFGSDSWTGDNIGLLSVEQALADYAVMLTALKAEWNATTSPVVAVGGSYGGMLAAWARIQYPNVFAAALAASAPIKIASGIPADPGFFETITNDFAGANESCPDLVRAGFAEIISLAQQGPTGLATISKAFKLCTPLTSADEVEHVILWAVNGFGFLAMCDYPYATDFLAPLPAWPIDYSCNLLLDMPDDPLAGLAAAAGLFYNGTGGSLPCFNVSAEFNPCADQTGCGTGPDGVSWDYQACTEITFGDMTTNNVTDMFPPRTWTQTNLTDYCVPEFDVYPSPEWIAIHFGGADISAASNIVFSNGLLDPWGGSGFRSNISDSLIAILIEDGAHHLDLRAPNAKDPASVVAARAQELALIKGWIGIDN